MKRIFKFAGLAAGIGLLAAASNPSYAQDADKTVKVGLLTDYSGVFAISILAQDAPLNLIGRFGFKSGREVDKFEGGAYRLGNNGCPIIKYCFTIDKC